MYVENTQILIFGSYLKQVDWERTSGNQRRHRREAHNLVGRLLECSEESLLLLFIWLHILYKRAAKFFIFRILGFHHNTFFLSNTVYERDCCNNHNVYCFIESLFFDKFIINTVSV